MKTRFLLLLFLVIYFLPGQAQVQSFGYKDNTFPWQVNIGKGTVSNTATNAWLEIGPGQASKKGILPPRGFKDSIQTPTPGMTIWDVPTQCYWNWANGQWEKVGGTTYTNEMARDVLGTMLKSSPTLDWYIDDFGDSAIANVKPKYFEIIQQLNDSTLVFVRGDGSKDTLVINPGGNASGAFSTVQQLNDSSFVLVRGNGTADTVVMRFGASTSGTTPNLQAVTDVGSITTQAITAAKFQTTNDKAALYNDPNGVGSAYFRKADGTIHTMVSPNYGGAIQTTMLEMNATATPPNVSNNQTGILWTKPDGSLNLFFNGGNHKVDLDGAGGITTESDPVALAKTITVNGNTQALSANPSFTTETPLAITTAPTGTTSYTIPSAGFYELDEPSVNNRGLVFPDPASYSGKRLVLLFPFSGGPNHWQTTATTPLVFNAQGASTLPRDWKQGNTYSFISTGTSWQQISDGMAESAAPVENDPQALAKNITVNGQTQPLSANPSFTVTDALQPLLQALGSTIKAQTPFLATSAGGLTSGQLRLCALYIPTATTITGVKWYQGASGVYTASNYNGFGLYTYSAGTLTLVASTTDDPNTWAATGSAMASKAFSATYNATPGVYYVGFIYSSSAQTTQPTIGIFSGSTGNFNNLDFANSAKLTAAKNTQTALPASTTMASTTNSGTNYWVALY